MEFIEKYSVRSNVIFSLAWRVSVHRASLALSKKFGLVGTVGANKYRNRIQRFEFTIQIEQLFMRAIKHITIIVSLAVALIRCMRVLLLRIRFRATNDDDDDEERGTAFLREKGSLMSPSVLGDLC